MHYTKDNDTHSSSENASVQREAHDNSCNLSSSNPVLANSASPDAVAHERYEEVNMM